MDEAGLRREEIQSGNYLETTDVLRNGIIGGNLGLVGAVLLAGGIFLIYKATKEIHHKLEGEAEHAAAKGVYMGIENHGGPISGNPELCAELLVYGMLASLLAAALPAWEATQAPPRQTLARASLEQRVSEKLGLIEICAIAAIAGGILALVVTDRSLVVGFAGMFLIVVGLALLVPGFVALLSRRLAGPIGRLAGLSTRMAIQGIGRSLSRTGVAVTALAVAVAATIGVDVMVGSFRGSVDAWLQRSLNADMYVAPPRLAGGHGPAMTRERERVVHVVEQHAPVATIDGEAPQRLVGLLREAATPQRHEGRPDSTVRVIRPPQAAFRRRS